MATAIQNQGVKVTLYWLETSRAHRVLWLLEELKVPYDVQVFKRTKQQLAPLEMKQAHPLGKAPSIAIHREGLPDIKIAESGTIIEYLVDNWGPQLRPQRFLAGQEAQTGAESPAFINDRWFMHAAEGTLMPLLIYQTIVLMMRGKKVPFFVRPVTSLIAGKIESAFLHARIHEILEYVESLAKQTGGPYLCGNELTEADVMMSFPLQGAQFAKILTKEKYPMLTEFISLIENRPAYKAAVKKTEEIDGKFELFQSF